MRRHRQVPGIWAASFEIGQIAERVPELKAQLVTAHEAARIGLVSLFLGVPEDKVDPETAHSVGSLLLAIIPRLFAQWMVNPSRGSSGRELAEGLRRIIATVEAP